ncbi:cytochrome C biogenesis protein [Leptospira langatensis]|uniref:Cytochrome c-type biogenesis protein n=1 Tax=Leptospira langatensis TaxID=2484983 RepID=A0A5F1ZVC7_9LEPT|nr:cytochrome c-type biogenesis protein CcmH [Leptospira langatensis]TGK00211.1 cytochrome C biogenesis protein [Leptospira langatensis]TGL41158.1 cytochrome C biogenesis protein [Leptospira langatensis]
MKARTFIDFRSILVAAFVFAVSASSSLVADSTFTNLTEPNQIRTFHDVTDRIRCICIPSIPIKSCSFNNCTVSAKLKLFIENRIRAGEDADTIVNKMVHGFGPEVVTDPIVAKFIENGNQGMAQSIVVGFGPDILAKPDSTWIDLSIAAAGALGVLLMYLYLKRRTAPKAAIATEVDGDSSFHRYISEIEEKQK